MHPHHGMKIRRYSTYAALLLVQYSQPRWTFFGSTKIPSAVGKTAKSAQVTPLHLSPSEPGDIPATNETDKVEKQRQMQS